MILTRNLKPIALVDMDDTVAGFSKQMLSDLRLLRSPSEPELPEQIEALDLQLHMKARMDLIKSKPGWWENLPRLQRGFAIVDMLEKMGYAIQVATKGPYTKPDAWAEKVKWCRRYMPGSVVHITEEKSALYGRVLVDDWPQYATEWLEWRPRGLVIMPAYAYNAHMADYPNVFRYNDYHDDDALKLRLIANIAMSKGAE